MTVLLRLRDIAVERGGRTILDIPRLEILAGESVAALGPNGAGKSTLLRTCGALLRPTRGQVYLDGLPAVDATYRRSIAAVLQRPLLRRGTVLDNAASGLRFHGVPRARAREEAARWLDRLGVAHLANRQARTLSGGEGQRVSITRALATAPRLLLLDEPFAALDEPSRGSLVADVRQLIDEQRIATLLVTHDRREAAALVGRVLVLDQGRLLADGPTAQILNDADLAAHIGGNGVLDEALAASLHDRERPRR